MSDKEKLFTEEFDEMMDALTNQEWRGAKAVLISFLDGHNVDPDSLRDGIRLIIEATKKTSDMARLMPGGVNTIPFMLTALNFRKYRERSLRYRFYLLRLRFIFWFTKFTNYKPDAIKQAKWFDAAYAQEFQRRHQTFEQGMAESRKSNPGE